MRISTTLGRRRFLSIADNGRNEAGDPQLYATRTVLDIEGNQRAVVDVLGRAVMRYDYDMLKTRLRQHSMEAGERWVLNDAAGQPLRTWNSRGYAFRMEYDELHRPAQISFAAARRASSVSPRSACSSAQFMATAPRPDSARQSSAHAT